MSVIKQMTTDQLREILTPAEAMTRITFDPRVTGLNGFVHEDGKVFLNVGDSHFDLTSDSYLHLGQMVGIPKAYNEKTPPSLTVDHMNYWMANKGLSQVSLAAEEVEGRGQVIKLFSRGAVQPVSNEQILEAVANRWGENLLVHHVSHDLFNTSFSVVSPDIQHEVAVGDAVRVGVTIDNSYALEHPLMISSYIHRLVCTNGAISTDNVYRYSYSAGGGGDGASDWLSEVIEEAFNQADAEVERLRRLKETKFNGHLSDALGGIYREFHVPTGVRKRITDRMMDTRIENLYDLYNAVTDIASNTEEILEDPRLTRRLMRIGGRIASHPEICGECFRVKN